jgi:hypothetical protein
MSSEKDNPTLPKGMPAVSEPVVFEPSRETGVQVRPTSELPGAEPITLKHIFDRMSSLADIALESLAATRKQDTRVSEALGRISANLVDIVQNGDGTKAALNELAAQNRIMNDRLDIQDRRLIDVEGRLKDIEKHLGSGTKKPKA